MTHRNTLPAIREVRSNQELNQFIRFPWSIYRQDPNWVPPLISERTKLLDRQANPFWQSAELACWIAWRGDEAVGTIAAILDRHRNEVLGQKMGSFGFFECVREPETARALIETAEAWLRARGMKRIVGPHNPTHSDEMGLLVEGFDSRPAVLETHTAPYYPAYFEQMGYRPYQELVARRLFIPRHARPEDLLPGRMIEIARRVTSRRDVRVRPVNMRAWEEDIASACRIYNAALAPLPGYVDIPEEEFQRAARGFRPIIDPEMALVAEVDGQPAAFALALPDANQALQKMNGRSDILAVIRYLWHSRRLEQLSFKILMVLPEFQGRGLESLLILRITERALQKKYRVVEMSLTGDENLKSNRLQERLGLQVYRRYVIYQKDL